MVKQTEVVEIKYGQHDVGAVSFNADKGYGVFEYAPRFIKTGIQLSPIKMPLSSNTYAFPQLPYPTFKGLPGMIADSLPDDFGNAVLNAWIASQGKSTADITPLQRLQYTGKRGMGALEYVPATRVQGLNASQQVEVESLVGIAQEILDARNDFSVALSGDGHEDRAAMLELMSVGMSAGGARPKAVLAFNEDYTQVRSGQAKVPEGFTHYLMKFDGVDEHNKDKETFGDPMGYSPMEYVYYLMATSCGIDMKKCALLPEGSRRHFITERFDREGNDKVHVQTLNGIAHVDYKQPGQYSYAELLGVARKLKLDRNAAEQLLRRMCFNIVAKNHDDHSKNFGFMLKGDTWKLAPAYDVAFSYRPGSKWINSHWMTLNGKRDGFTRKDFYSLERLGSVFSRTNVDKTLDETIEQVSKWTELAKANDVPKTLIEVVGSNLRLDI